MPEKKKKAKKASAGASSTKAAPNEKIDYGFARKVMPVVAYEDMTQINDMTEETVLNNIHDRYKADLIYTFSTSILVSVNPYKATPFYDMDVMRCYFHQRLGEQPPHLFAVAEDAYTTMVDSATNISVLVSGESGAGKTECTKVILKYLSARTGRQSKIESKLIATVPVLESMGNAKTIRNNNSSRFGKYILIQFGNDGFISGSKINHYLLEKFRLVFQSKDERNFHIFYMMTMGMPADKQKTLQVGPPESYHYLSQSGCTTVPGMDEKKEFTELADAMKLFDLDDDMQMDIFGLLSAILHLGNISWKNSGQASPADIKDDKSDKALATAAALLKLPKDDLLGGLNTKKTPVRNEIMVINLDAEKARSATDALAKAIYAKLFDWMVAQLNSATHASKYEQRTFFGLLDIFGFEELQKNSLEQLLINYANEKLQKFFNAQIFTMEQQEYEREGIDWTKIEFKDNQPCLDLIEKSRNPVGILALLDEESRFPKATDQTYLEKMNNSLATNAYFIKERIVRTNFGVRHYAGEVLYDVTEWLEKNRDEIPDHMLQILRECEFDLLSELFAEKTEEDIDPDEGGGGGRGGMGMDGTPNPSPGVSPAVVRRRAGSASGESPLPGVTPARPAGDRLGVPGRGGGGRGGGGGGRGGKPKKLTVGGQFKGQLQALMDLMWATTPYFVRCVKPNDKKRSDLFNAERVFDQLRYAGMIETIKIRRMGYPIRYVHREFYRRYKCLVKGLEITTGKTDEQVANLIAPKLKMTEDLWQMGKTKVFLKQETANMLEERRTKIRTVATLQLQCWWRMITIRKNFLLMRRAAVIWQSLWRMYVKRVAFVKQRNAAVVIQGAYRIYKAKKLLAKLKKAEEERRRKEAEALRKKLGKEKAKQVEEERKRKEKEELAALVGNVKAAELEKSEKEAAQPAGTKTKKKKKKKRAPKKKKKRAPKKIMPEMTRLMLDWTNNDLRRVDMDLSVLQFDRRGNMVDSCFYNQFQTKDGSLKHAGDDRQRQDNRGSEMMVINTSKVQAACRVMVILVTTYSDGYTFKFLESLSISLFDAKTMQVVDSQVLDCEKKYPERSALIPFCVVKKKNQWILSSPMGPASGKQYMEALPDIHKLLDFHQFIKPLVAGKKRLVKKTYRMIKGQETAVDPQLSHVTVSLGWVGKVDLDLSAVLFHYNEYIGFVDPDRNRRAKGIVHKGDSKVGSGKGDDEKIVLKLADIERRVTSIIFVVTMFKGEGGLRLVDNSHVKVVGQTGRNKKDLWTFNLQDAGPRSACMIVKLYRAGVSKWRVVKMGEPSYGYYYEQMIPKMIPYLDPPPPRREFTLKVHHIRHLVPEDVENFNFYFTAHFAENDVQSTPIKEKNDWRQTVTLAGSDTGIEVNFFQTTTHMLGQSNDKFASLFLAWPVGSTISRQWVPITLLYALKSKAGKLETEQPFIQISILATDPGVVEGDDAKPKSPRPKSPRPAKATP